MSGLERITVGETSTGGAYDVVIGRGALGTLGCVAIAPDGMCAAMNMTADWFGEEDIDNAVQLMIDGLAEQ